MFSLFKYVAQGLGILSIFSSFSVVAEVLPVAVEVQPVSWQQYAHPVRISGLLENGSEQNLAFKVGGLVHKVSIEEGQWVKQGQILAALDGEEIEAQVAKATAMMLESERHLERFKSLRGQEALSLEQMQRAETQLDVARSDLTIALFNQRHALIRAPADGRVLKRMLENNEMVSAGQPVFVFAPRNQGWIMRAGITDRDAVRLQLDDRAVVHMDAYPGQTFEASISEVAGRADATQTFEVKLKLNESVRHPFLAGFVAHAVITPQKTQRVMRLPPSALVRADRGVAQVYVVNDQTQAEVRELVLFGWDGEHLLISSGLEEGEQVVVTGAQYLRPGKAVNLRTVLKP